MKYLSSVKRRKHLGAPLHNIYRYKFGQDAQQCVCVRVYFQWQNILEQLFHITAF